jgi:glutathione peroxidase
MPPEVSVKLLSTILLLTAFALASPLNSIYSLTVTDIDGKPAPLSQFKGKVLLVVNVASRCGYTPQYERLQALYSRYKDRGLVVVGFPANNFMGQEPGSNPEIKEFCTRKYNVSFPMMAKISVKGDDQAPLYQYLTDVSKNPTYGGDIKWNFTKFLIDRSGRVVNRFEPATEPDNAEVLVAIEAALGK